MLMQSCLNIARGVNGGVVILENRAFSRKKSLNHRVNMICENASIMVTCRMMSIHGKILPHTPSQNLLHISRLESGSKHKMLMPVFVKREDVGSSGI
ncbi:hypothetical protein TNCV_4223781, partial [Trichonephila clavipes]